MSTAAQKLLSPSPTAERMRADDDKDGCREDDHRPNARRARASFDLREDRHGHCCGVADGNIDRDIVARSAWSQPWLSESVEDR